MMRRPWSHFSILVLLLVNLSYQAQASSLADEVKIQVSAEWIDVENSDPHKVGNILLSVQNSSAESIDNINLALIQTFNAQSEKSVVQFGSIKPGEAISKLVNLVVRDDDTSPVSLMWSLSFDDAQQQVVNRTVHTPLASNP